MWQRKHPILECSFIFLLKSRVTTNEWINMPSNSCVFTFDHRQMWRVLLDDYEHCRGGCFCPGKTRRPPLLCSELLVRLYAAFRRALLYSDSMPRMVEGLVEDAWGCVLHTAWTCLQKVPGGTSRSLASLRGETFHFSFGSERKRVFTVLKPVPLTQLHLIFHGCN